MRPSLLGSYKRVRAYRALAWSDGCLSGSVVRFALSAYGSEKLFDRPTAHDGASGLHVVVQPSGLVILTLKK